MRKYYQKILKETFYKYLTKERSRLDLTQEKMAEILEISLRNFSNLDNRKSCCGSLTLTLFLIYCTDPVEFLKELKFEYENRAIKEFSQEAVSYRQKLPVKELRLYESDNSIYPLCPRCTKTMEKEYVKFCANCGQRLKWTDWEKSSIIKTLEKV